MDRSIPVPVIKENELVIVPHEGLIHLYYGITKDSIWLHMAALAEIERYVFNNNLGKGKLSKDFRLGMRTSQNRWFCYKMDMFLDSNDESVWLNVFESRTEEGFNHLIEGNNGGYERIYWYQQEVK
jgi:hypothetical protein